MIQDAYEHTVYQQLGREIAAATNAAIAEQFNVLIHVLLGGGAREMIFVVDTFGSARNFVRWRNTP